MGDWFEPLGLVTGPAVCRSGAGLPLQGGPLRFLLARRIGEDRVMPAEVVPEPWRTVLTRRPPPFAGLAEAGRPLVMGIINVTPDSFSGDGRMADQDRAIAQGQAMRAAGAAILDVGGESTRPGAPPVPPAEELRRVLPVSRALAGIAPVSIDTRNAATMEAALAAGADVVDVVTGLRHDPAALPLVAAAGAPVIIMHMPTTDPRTRPSMFLRHTARTVLSPMCWLTSAVMTSVSPAMVRPTVRAKPISGRASGGNSTSMTGPVTARMRPSDVLRSATRFSATAMNLSPNLWLRRTEPRLHR